MSRSPYYVKTHFCRVGTFSTIFDLYSAEILSHSSCSCVLRAFSELMGTRRIRLSSSSRRFSIGLRSGLCAGVLITFGRSYYNHSFTVKAECFGSFSRYNPNDRRMPIFSALLRKLSFKMLKYTSFVLALSTNTMSPTPKAEVVFTVPSFNSSFGLRRIVTLLFRQKPNILYLFRLVTKNYVFPPTCIL